MAVSTYTELVSEMGAWLDRTDLTARIPTFIRLFEARMNRRLRSPDMERSYSFTTVAGTLSYAVSSGVRELRELYLQTSDDPLLNYTLVGETIVFDEDPGSDLTVYYTAYTTLTGLDDGNPTNWLLDDHPDAYLFGSLCMAEAHLRDTDQLAIWKSAWDEALSEIIREANQKRLPAGPLKMQSGTIE